MPAVDVEAVEDALRGWVLSALEPDVGERVIFADQGQPRPERPYADISIDAIETRGRDDQRPIDEDGLRDVVGVRALRATVRCFGDNALGLAETARSALWLEPILDELRVAGLAFWRAEPALDITTEIDTALEPRAAFEALFGVAALQNENVGIIECVEGTGTYKDAAGTIVREQDYGTCVPDALLLTIGGEPITLDGEPITVS
jgi:hypothetical protein